MALHSIASLSQDRNMKAEALSIPKIPLPAEDERNPDKLGRM